jgi:hypothetical protein
VHGLGAIIVHGCGFVMSNSMGSVVQGLD